MKGPEFIKPKEGLSEITIDRYTPADRDALIAGVSDIQEVERESVETRRPGSEMGEEYVEDLLSEIESKRGAIFMARSEGRVAGFIACYVKHDEDDLLQAEAAKTYGYISDVWVDESLRDRRLFTQLKELAVAHFAQFPDVQYVKLDVVAGNARAQAAYLREGFAPEEIRMAMKINRSRRNS